MSKRSLAALILQGHDRWTSAVGVFDTAVVVPFNDCSPASRCSPSLPRQPVTPPTAGTYSTSGPGLRWLLYSTVSVRTYIVERVGISSTACNGKTLDFGIEVERVGGPAVGRWRLPPVSRQLVGETACSSEVMKQSNEPQTAAFNVKFGSA